jgi:hypothetical protein
LAVIETDSEATLNGVLENRSFRALVWLRLGPTRALVDPEAVEELVQQLEADGITPRFCYELTE